MDRTKFFKRKEQLNYVISTSGRHKKTLLVHINMLQPYVQRDKCFDCNIVDNGFNSNQVNVSLVFNHRLVTYLWKIVNYLHVYYSRVRLTSILHQS